MRHVRDADGGYQFDKDIAVSDAGPGSFSADLSSGWTVNGAVNGGYVCAVVGNAMTHATRRTAHTHPINVSSYFLAPSVPGPATISLSVLRVGHHTTTLSAQVLQGGAGERRVRAQVVATFGQVAGATTERQIDLPLLPPVEDCVLPTLPGMSEEEVRRYIPMIDRYDHRLDPKSAGWQRGEPSGLGTIQGWFRFKDNRPPDALALLMMVDAMPPATVDLGTSGWAPTVELTTHVLADPEPGWATIRQSAQAISGERLEEDCEIWDSRGVLCARSRQLALLPRPSRGRA